jgi:hypothetical protein
MARILCACSPARQLITPAGGRRSDSRGDEAVEEFATTRQSGGSVIRRAELAAAVHDGPRGRWRCFRLGFPRSAVHLAILSYGGPSRFQDARRTSLDRESWAASPRRSLSKLEPVNLRFVAAAIAVCLILNHVGQDIVSQFDRALRRDA